MKKIPLSKGKFALVDDADFDWLNQWKWSVTKNGKHHFYAERSRVDSNGKRSNIRMHRLILGLTDRSILADHIDGNGLNNQRSNLRPCTSSQNHMNSHTARSSSSIYKGVGWFSSENKWRARIGTKHIGLFPGTAEGEISAAIAYNEHATILYGEFACLNKIP